MEPSMCAKITMTTWISA